VYSSSHSSRVIGSALMTRTSRSPPSKRRQFLLQFRRRLVQNAGLSPAHFITDRPLRLSVSTLDRRNITLTPAAAPDVQFYAEDARIMMPSAPVTEGG
jgi:hypothetical protein